MAVCAAEGGERDQAGLNEDGQVEKNKKERKGVAVCHQTYKGGDCLRTSLFFPFFFFFFFRN